MRSVFSLLVLLSLLAIAVALGVTIQGDPGYVLIHLNNSVFETSFWFLIAIVFLLFVILYALTRVVINLLRISLHYSRWKDKSDSHKSLRLVNMAYSDFACGNWRAAEKNFLSAARHKDLGISCYLLAARSANAQGAFKRRDSHLNKAFLIDENDSSAILLTAAQMQVGAQQWDAAKATLQQLPSKVLKTEQALRLASKVAVQTHDWPGLHAMMPNLRKQGSLNADQVDGMEERIYSEHINAARANMEEVIIIWNSLPRKWRQDSKLLALYAEILIQHARFDAALPVLQSAVNLHWDPALIKLYGQVQSSDPKAQLKQAAKWLKSHPDDVSLLLTMAQLSYGLKLWGQCKDYCEDSIAVQPSARAYQLLGAALEELDQSDAAMECYRKGLELGSPLKQL